MRQYTQTKGYSVKALLEIADRFGYIVECHSNHSTLHPGYYLCARQGVLRSPYPRRARRIAARRMLPKGMDDRSNRLQRAMAFIGEHRELIPLLRYCHHLTSGGRRIDFSEMVVLYTRTSTLPDMVYYQDRDYHIKGVGYRCSSGITHISELIEQVPYLPKAWRCA